MKIYKDGELYVEITSPDELLGMYQTIANNLRNNYFSNVEVMKLIASARSIYQVATMPSEPTINTVYYVGTEAPYDVKLVDSNGTVVPLGNSDADFSNFYTKTECDYRFLDKQNFLNNLYPKDSIYPTWSYKNPSTFLGGTWELIGGQDANLNYYPAFAIETDTAGTTISESAPNIKASYRPGGNWPITNLRTDASNNPTVVNGAFSLTNEEITLMISSTTATTVKPKVMNFDASNSNPIYQDGAHVNVNAIKIFFWRRTDDAPIVFNTGNITMDTELDENATDNNIPTSKAVVDYVKEHGSEIVETVLWQSPNGINGTSFYSRPTNITLTDNIKDYHLFKFTISRDDSKINSYYLTLKDIQLYAGSSYRFMPSLSYDSELSYLEVDIPVTTDTNIFHINNSNKCNLVNITGYKSIPMLNTYSREIRELIMNTPVGTSSETSGNITLTKGMSNYDYLDIYYQCADFTSINSNKRIRVSDLIEYYNNSSLKFRLETSDLDSNRKYISIYRSSDTVIHYDSYNLKMMKIYGIKAEPVVQGSPAYKQLYYNANGVSSGNITLNDAISKFKYIEILGRRDSYLFSSKANSTTFINSNNLILNTANYSTPNFVYIHYVSDTSVSVSNSSTENALTEVIGWY